MKFNLAICMLLLTACVPQTLPYRAHGPTLYDSLQRQEQMRLRAMQEMQRTQALEEMAWQMRFQR